MAKGKSGSFRAESLTASDLAAMENHELRLDHAGHRRSVRMDAEGDPIPPLVHNPLRMDSLTQAHAAHIKGARTNKAAGKICRHAFVQFPTDLSLTPEVEQMMLDQAVAFVNQTHGGNAVFWARLDRDEAGRHGVDVFFAPRYEKATKRGTEPWISLTKFGKERAIERFDQRQAEKKNPKTGKFEKVTDKAGAPVMVPCDSQHFQGRAFQDLWFEHLRDVVGLEWVERGTRKVGRDPDRLAVEEYKLAEERRKTAEEARIASEALATRETELARGKAALAAREAMLGVREKELEQQQAWIVRGVGNLQVAVQRALSGKHDIEITPADMAKEPEKFEILRKAAPAGRPTFGWRARFWSLHYNGLPVDEKHLPSKIREALEKAFDQVAKFAREISGKRQEAEVEAQKILTAARARGKEIASEPGQVRSAHALISLFRTSLREVLSDAAYERVKAKVNIAWAAHPDNINRPELPAPSSYYSSGPSGP